MPEATSCQPCCSTPTTVNVPGVAGTDGADGAAGTAGVNAFTVTTADFVVPAVGATVVVSVTNSTWMVVGQKIFVGGSINGASGTGGGYYQVSSIPGSTSVVLTFLGYEDDVAVGTTMDSGDGVSPGGTQAVTTSNTLSEYLTTTDRDSAFELSASEAAVVISSNTLDLTIDQAGTWLIMARLRIDYSEATYASDNQPANMKLRRTNNTPADIGNTTSELILRDVTEAYFTAGIVNLPSVLYTTTATTDVISLFAWLDSLPDNTAANGKMLVYEASLVAIKVA